MRCPPQDNSELCICVRDIPLPGGVIHLPVRKLFFLECCIEGTGSITVNGTKFLVGPRDCYVLFPEYPLIYTTDHTNPRRGYSCLFNGTFIERALTCAGITPEAPFLPSELFPAILSRIKKVEKLSTVSDISSEYMRMSLLYEILSIMAQNGHSKERNTWTNQVLGLIDSRYNQPITTQWLADQMGLERCYFSTLFKKQIGKSPLDYLNSVRIEKACNLLKETDAPISSVAESVGMSDKSFFRIFKKLVGKTPRQYKMDP